MMKEENSGQPCEPQQVRAIKDNKGEDVTDLEFAEGDIIEMTRKDGAGYAYGTLKDGSTGWFPLENVEQIHETAVAEVGAKTGETALDAFIKEAKEKGGAAGPRKIIQTNKKMTLVNFLNDRPMVEQLVEKNILPSSEITEQVAAAEKRLIKNQKKSKKELPEIIAEKLAKGWLPENPLKLSEDQFDRIAQEILIEIPLIKQKQRFTTYENVFTGATLIQHLKAGGPAIIPSWQDGIPNEQVIQLAGNLVEKNYVFNIANPGKKTFKTKHLYQVTRNTTDYSFLNMNKVCHKFAEPVNGYKASIALIGELIEAMKKYLPNDFEALRNSKEVYAFSLQLATLQQVTLDNLSNVQKKVFWINLFNCLILYAHIRFTPPANAMQKRLMYEHCLVFVNKQRHSIQDVENEVLKSAKEDPMVYLCVSDGTASTPATFIFSEENFEETKTFAARHFFHRALIFNASNYEIQYPRLIQRMWKDLGFEKENLIHVIAPFLSGDRREEIKTITELGHEFEVKFLPYNYAPSYIFEEDSPLSPR